MSKNYSVFGAIEGVVVFFLIAFAYPFRKVENRVTALVVAALLLAAVLINPGFPQVDAAPDNSSNPHREMVSKAQDVELGSMRFFVGPQGMGEGVDRSDACRTFHVFGHQVEQTGETDAMSCGFPVTITATVGVTPTAELTSTPEITVTVVVTATPSATPTVIPTGSPTVVPTGTPEITPTVEVTPTVEPTQPPATETPVVITSTPAAPGNPGNDKPVGQTEHCEKGMCENEGGQDGEHGQSGNDSGRGNHDH